MSEAKAQAIDPIDLNSIDEIDRMRGGDGTPKSIRETYRLCAAGQLPVFKLGKKYRGRSSTFAEHFRRLEQRVAGE